MRLLILGASGKCGQWLTRFAAESGHDVTAVVREGTEVRFPSRVVVRHGDVTHARTLDEAVAGQDVVLSTLGLRRASKNPWARLLSPPDLTTRVTQLLVPAMRRHDVARVIALSAAGVGDSVAMLTWATRLMVAAGNVGAAYRDLASMEAALATSGLDWMVVRPVTLVDGAPKGDARPVTKFRLSSTIRRADVAKWMLAAAERKAASGERYVFIGT